MQGLSNPLSRLLRSPPSHVAALRRSPPATRARLPLSDGADDMDHDGNVHRSVRQRPPVSYTGHPADEFLADAFPGSDDDDPSDSDGDESSDSDDPYHSPGTWFIEGHGGVVHLVNLSISGISVDGKTYSQFKDNGSRMCAYQKFTRVRNKAKAAAGRNKRRPGGIDDAIGGGDILSDFQFTYLDQTVETFRDKGPTVNGKGKKKLNMMNDTERSVMGKIENACVLARCKERGKVLTDLSAPTKQYNIYNQDHPLHTYTDAEKSDYTGRGYDRLHGRQIRKETDS